MNLPEVLVALLSSAQLLLQANMIRVRPSTDVVCTSDETVTMTGHETRHNSPLTRILYVLKITFGVKWKQVSSDERTSAV